MAPFGTGWLDANTRSEPLPAYDAVRAGGEQEWDVGDPAGTRAAILAVVDAVAAVQDLP